MMADKEIVLNKEWHDKFWHMQSEFGRKARLIQDVTSREYILLIGDTVNEFLKEAQRFFSA